MQSHGMLYRTDGFWLVLSHRVPWHDICQYPARMGIARLREFHRAKIRNRFDAFFAVITFPAFLALVGMGIYCGPQLFQKAPPPISVAVIRHPTSASPRRPNWVLLTNTSDRRYRYTLRPEVLTDGSWHTAISGTSEPPFAGEMSPWSALLFSLPKPQPADASRLTLVARRVLGGAETKVCRLLQSLNLDYPFDGEFEVTGIEF